MESLNISFETYKEGVINDILDTAPNSVEKGRLFAHYMVGRWLNITPDDDDLFYCDGSGDGGIDLAYLQRASSLSDGETDSDIGDTWYLIQSKFGAAFQGENTLISEGRKVIETLEGKRQKLSSLSSDVLERIEIFAGGMSSKDRVVLVFATTDPLTENHKSALEDIKRLSRGRLKFDFEVEAISLYTIYRRLIDVENSSTSSSICVPLSLHIPPTEEGTQLSELLVGTVDLPNIYEFLKGYRTANEGDLDTLYEKNVRMYLGSRGKVNKQIEETLKEKPELFGFYNNGITIVAKHFEFRKDGRLELCEPSIVNGCQTTRSIWEVFDKKENSGGTGNNIELAEWKIKAYKGSVVVKIVKVAGNEQKGLLKNITRFTNSQNAVKEQDFIALESGFKSWQLGMAKNGIYLEIQRGGKEAQKQQQKNKPSSQQYGDFVNAFDLLKVFGAGWLSEPGQAWNKNAAFLPNAKFFNEIVSNGFGPDDLLVRVPRLIVQLDGESLLSCPSFGR